MLILGVGLTAGLGAAVADGVDRGDTVGLGDWAATHDAAVKIRMQVESENLVIIAKLSAGRSVVKSIGDVR